MLSVGIVRGGVGIKHGFVQGQPIYWGYFERHDWSGLGYSWSCSHISDSATLFGKGNVVITFVSPDDDVEDVGVGICFVLMIAGRAWLPISEGIY